MPQLEVSIDEAAKAEGLTAVHVQRVAEVDGRFAEPSSHGTFRIGGGVGRTMCVDPGHYSLDAYWRTPSNCHRRIRAGEFSRSTLRRPDLTRPQESNSKS